MYQVQKPTRRSLWTADHSIKRGKVNDINDVNALSECFNNVCICGAAIDANTLQDINVVNNATNVTCDYEIIHPSSSSLQKVEDVLSSSSSLSSILNEKEDVIELLMDVASQSKATFSNSLNAMLRKLDYVRQQVSPKNEQ